MRPENPLLWGTQLEMPDDDMTALASTLAHQLAKQLGAELAPLYDVPESALRRSAIADSFLASEALGLVRRHELQAAIQATNRLVEAFPNEPSAHALRVAASLQAWHRTRSPASASLVESSLGTLERVDPEHPLIEISRAFVQSGKGQVRESIPRFTHVLSRNDLTPDLRAHVLTLRGWNDDLAGDPNAAIRDLEANPAIGTTSGTCLRPCAR